MKITIDRDLVEQALEAMLNFPDDISDEMFESITVLKTALAESAQEPDPGEYHGWVLREVLFEKGEPVGHREPVQEPVEHSIVAGALFDFMGWLTSRKKRIVLSSADDASPAVEVITEFAKMRGLSLHDAKVQDWQGYLTAPPQGPREHVTDDSSCWCNPETVYTDPDTGASVIVHKEPQ